MMRALGGFTAEAQRALRVISQDTPELEADFAAI
jgi:hypothetical protein